MANNEASKPTPAELKWFSQLFSNRVPAFSFFGVPAIQGVVRDSVDIVFTVLYFSFLPLTTSLFSRTQYTLGRETIFKFKLKNIERARAWGGEGER